MQFVKPHLFQEAVEKIGARSPIGSKLTSAEWRDVPVALRERAMFSSQVENVRFLQRARDGIHDFLTASRDESGALAMDRQRFVKLMSEFALKEGMGPLEGDSRSSSLQDITSQQRLELIFDTNVRAAQDFGNWKQGMDPDVLNEFPAQRFIRVIEVDEPRDWHSQFEGGVWLKSDVAAWSRINQDFGVPWGPWGWGCGHDVEDVDRNEAEALGLIQPAQRAEPALTNFNERLQASVKHLDADLRAKLQEQFGDQISIEGDEVKWVRSEKSEVGGQRTEVRPNDQGSTESRPTTESKPVSAALANTISKKATREQVNHAIRTIDAVHDDGVLPPIKIDGRTDPGNLGEYSRREARIGVRSTGDWPTLTAVHEIGHLLDHRGLGLGSRMATELNDTRLAGWLKAVQASEAFAELKRASDALPSRHFAYLMSGPELWARSYAQYIAEKSGDAVLLEDVRKVRDAFAPRQWSPEDFKPIREAMDKLFQELGWL
jgi:hypothetical protein